LASKTSTPELLGAYVRHIRSTKTAKSAQTDIYYLRDLFGPVCDELKVTTRKLTAKKRPRKDGEDRRRKKTVLDAAYLEQVTTAQISSFIRATWSGTSYPSISSGRDIAILPLSAWTGGELVEPLPASATIETEERHAEAGGRDRNRHAQQQTENATEPAAFAECETKSDDHDGQDTQRLCHRAGEAGQHLVQWAFPWKRLPTIGSSGKCCFWKT
jgi:hypothetical protein